MKLPYRMLWILYVAFGILWGCTENPFFKDKIAATKTIRGKVELNDGATPNDVFVWLKDFEVGTRTDETGFFELTLPPPAKQPGGGLNGIFNLYFYVANYRLDFAKVVILNGNVEYSKGDLNERGELRQPKRLYKLLDITISIDPTSVTVNSQDTITAYVTLRATEDTVRVSGLFSEPAFKGDVRFMAGFIRRVDPDESLVDTIYNTSKSYGNAYFPVGNSPLTLVPLVIYYEFGMFPPGEYEIIPYLLIQQENIPSRLIRSLGEDVEDFGPDFLNIPLKIQGNRFRVEEKSKI